MFRRMITDVLQWAALAAWLLIAFGAFFAALFAEPHGSSSLEMCAGTQNVDESFADLTHVLIVFMEATIGGNIPFDCMRASSSGFLADAMLILFIIVQNVMLLNMLIAMMAKTFDTVNDRSMVFYLYGKAKQCNLWMLYKPVPPPLNLVSLPYFIVVQPVHILFTVVSKRCRRRRARGGKEDFEPAARSVKAPYKFPKGWLARNDVDSFVDMASKFAREDKEEAELRSKQMDDLSERVDKLLEHIVKKDATRSAIAWLDAEEEIHMRT